MNRTYENYDFHKAIAELKRAESMLEPVVVFSQEGVIKAYNRAVAWHEMQKAQKETIKQADNNYLAIDDIKISPLFQLLMLAYHIFF